MKKWVKVIDKKNPRDSTLIAIKVEKAKISHACGLFENHMISIGDSYFKISERIYRSGRVFSNELVKICTIHFEERFKEKP